MTPTEYLETVRVNTPKVYGFVCQSGATEDIIHAAIGASTEAGELLDAVKKLMAYSKPLDLTNVQEELGDMLWYIGLACCALGTTFEQLMDMNYRKLALRYPEKFTTFHALNRDLDAERASLEQSSKG